MTARNRPIELVEESLQLLRSRGIGILLLYWMGAVPFAIALLLLLNDMRKSWGASLDLRDSLICAVAFLWLSYWKNRASRAVLAVLVSGSERPVSWSESVVWQAVFQTLKLFVMPFAMLSLVAWPAASAFFRTLALDPDFRRAYSSATNRYKENLLAFLIMAALSLVTYVNVLLIFIATPVVWKMLTGYETDWGRLGASSISGLLIVAGITTGLLVDPWIQTYAVLRVFYQSARSDGRDLLRDIARYAAVFLISVLAVAAQPSQAKLDESISHAAEASDYGWLHPQQSSGGENFLTDLVQKVEQALTDTGNRLKNWLRHLFHDEETKNQHQTERPAKSQGLRWTLGLLAVLICGGIVALFLRRGKPRLVEVPATSAAADVLNEQLLPSDVDQEQWLRLAFEYLGNNETRLAARAFYLANLSYLGAKSLLSLSLTKSNKLYERELARQTRSNQISPAFVTCNRLYERAWYGMRELGAEQVETLKGAADQLRQHA